MNGFIRISTIISVLALLASTPLHAEDAVFSVGKSAIDKPIDWQTFSTGMSDQQYRSAYKNNQRRIGKFLKSYSENSLLSMGVPKAGVKVIGVAAGLAANRDATLYLNKSKIMALQFKDVVNDDRAMFIGIKMDW